MLSAIVLASIVEESANHASLSALAIDHQSQTIELPDGVNAARVDSLSSVLGEPDVEVSTSSLGAIDSEIDISDPMISQESLLTPDRAALVSGS